ncbi:MAG: ATP synthase F1 subunit epsilon [Lachnospiraceae bacterium]|nr:ATP synthase F1 subunit epsilon [Lachnospiraceae bacterium]
MAVFHLKIISSRRVFYDGSCHCLIIPGLDGELAIMAQHEEMIAAIRTGEMRLQTEENGDWQAAVVGEGFCQVAHNRVTLLADEVELPEELDVRRAREALENAKEQMRQKQSAREYHMTQAAMARALVRLKEAERFSGAPDRRRNGFGNNR